MKKLLIPLILITICCFSGQPISSQVSTGTSNGNYMVSVFVVCDDDNTKMLAESYIKRELRSLGNVTIRPKIFDPSDLDFGLYLTIIEGIYTTGQKNGKIHISAAYTIGPHKNIEISDVKYTSGLYIGSYLLVNYTNLQDACKEHVAMFDTRVLEKEREARKKR